MKKAIISLSCFILILVIAACSSTGVNGIKKYYAVTFVQSGQPDVVKAVAEGGSLSEIPSVKQKTGYTVAWEDKKLTKINSNITVNAIETANEYTVTYNAAGGSVDQATQKITYDSEYTLLTPLREDYTFVCWKNGDYSVSISGKWNVADDVTLTAAWLAPTMYTITFVQDGKQNKVKSVIAGKDFTDIPRAEEVTGYTVVWNEEELAALKNVNENNTIHAIATANKYTVTYDANGGSVDKTTQLITFDCDYVLAVPTRDGYDFSCWKNGETSVSSSGKWNVAKDVMLTAEWTIKAVENYTVTFVQDGRENIVKTVSAGETLTDVPSPSEVEGYYAAWDISDFSSINSNITVNAVLTPKDFTVNLNANGGTIAVTSQKITFGCAYNLGTPERTHYTFVGWKNGATNVATSGKWNVADDVTLTAEWIENAKYTVTFIQNGQIDVTRTAYRGETITNVPAPVAITGYDVAWDVTDFSKISENTTVTAVITPKTYIVSFELGALSGDSNASISSHTQSVKYGEEYNLLNPSCFGYFFTGWVIKGTDTKFENGTYTLNTNLTLVATWKEDPDSDRWWTKNY